MQVHRQYFKIYGILALPIVYILKCLMYIKEMNEYPDTETILILSFLDLNEARVGFNYYCVHFSNKLPNEIKCLCNIHKMTIRNFLKIKAFYSFNDYFNDDFTDFVGAFNILSDVCHLCYFFLCVFCSIYNVFFYD